MALNNLYQIYINKCMMLASTIVIKSTETAEAINRFIVEYYGKDALNTLDPTTWKYYLNIAGEYHFHDEPMYVVSLDTLDKILFSKEQLALHRATARGYAYGTRKYKELVAQYPKQEMLILGILYPVDMAGAIAAPNGKILGFPDGLVEPNEYSLIPKLQDWIDGFRIRWINQQYGISDELYSATSLGIMYLNLVPAILTLRLEACKTNEAHSFHVRQYLASHGALDSYLDHLTLKQALFFYRNIAYIERNTGQQNIFEWLVEHIMSERNIPIAEYVMRHNLAKQPEELYPELVFRKKQLNLGYDSDPLVVANLTQILDKEDPLARDNNKYREESYPEIKEQMENSISNVVLTKLLESSMIDYSNSSPYTMEEILMSHWLYLSTTGNFSAYIGLDNPRTGERIPLTVKEAYIFMWYAMCSSLGIDLEVIPPVFAERVQRMPTPSVKDLMSVVDTSLVPREIAVQALALQPTIDRLISTEAFYNKCVEIYKAANAQRNIYASQEHMTRRAMVHNMISRIYSDNICYLATPGKKYGEWFSERNLDIKIFTRDELYEIYLTLVREATGLSLTTTNSLKALQAAMIKMMAQLSSYSVQFVAEINQSDIRLTDWTAVRVGDTATSTSGHRYIDAIRSGPQGLHGTFKQSAALDVTMSNILEITVPKASQTAHYEIRTEVLECCSREIRHIHVEAASVNVHLTEDFEQNELGIIPVFGIREYLQLTPEQRSQVKDVWTN